MRVGVTRTARPEEMMIPATFSPKAPKRLTGAMVLPGTRCLLGWNITESGQGNLLEVVYRKQRAALVAGQAMLALGRRGTV